MQGLQQSLLDGEGDRDGNNQNGNGSGSDRATDTDTGQSQADSQSSEGRTRPTLGFPGLTVFPGDLDDGTYDARFTPHSLDSHHSGGGAGGEGRSSSGSPTRRQSQTPAIVTTAPKHPDAWKMIRDIQALNRKKKEQQVDYWRTNMTSRNSVSSAPSKIVTWGGRSAEKVHYWPKCCRHPGGKCWLNLETFVFLGLLGSLTSTVALGYRVVCTVVQNAVTAIPYLVLNTTKNGTYVPAAGHVSGAIVGIDLAATVGCSVVLALMSVLMTQLIAPHAMGSGIPRMKLLFSGVYISKFLSVKTVVVKFFALMCAAASGLSVGSEGPFVHISCGIARTIMRLPFFQSYRFNAVKAHGMLVVGCATGVVAAFGSPFGGVLFAIEVVSTFFRISDLPRMFWASIAGTFTARFLFRSGLSLFSADTKPNYVIDYPTCV